MKKMRPLPFLLLTSLAALSTAFLGCSSSSDSSENPPQDSDAQAEASSDEDSSTDSMIPVESSTEEETSSPADGGTDGQAESSTEEDGGLEASPDAQPDGSSGFPDGGYREQIVTDPKAVIQAVSPNQDKVAIYSDTGTGVMPLTVWDEATRQTASLGEGQYLPPIDAQIPAWSRPSVPFKADGSRVMYLNHFTDPTGVPGNRTADLYAYDFATQSSTRLAATMHPWWPSAQPSPDWNWVAYRGHASALEVSSLNGLPSLSLAPSVRTISFSPDSHYLAFCTQEGALSVWTVGTAHTASVASNVLDCQASFTKDGTKLFYINDVSGEPPVPMGSLKVWDAASQTTQEIAQGVSYFELSADGLSLAYRHHINLTPPPMSGALGVLKLDGSFNETLHNGVYGFRFSQDGTRLIYHTDFDSNSVSFALHVYDIQSQNTGDVEARVRSNSSSYIPYFGATPEAGRLAIYGVGNELFYWEFGVGARSIDTEPQETLLRFSPDRNRLYYLKVNPSDGTRALVMWDSVSDTKTTLSNDVYFAASQMLNDSYTTLQYGPGDSSVSYISNYMQLSAPTGELRVNNLSGIDMLLDYDVSDRFFFTTADRIFYVVTARQGADDQNGVYRASMSGALGTYQP